MFFVGKKTLSQIFYEMKYRLEFLPTLAAFSLLFFACENDSGKRNIEPYYFPLKELEDGRVYEYRPAGNPNDPPIYWYFKSLKKGGSQFLLGMSYDPEFTPDQFVREERVENGMLLVDFITYEKDSTGKKQSLQATIEAPNVFPFTVKENAGVLLSSVNWRTLNDSVAITHVRNRQYDSDTVFVFKGKRIPAVKFNTRELIDQEVEGHLELEYGGSEVYAKGIGLASFQKNIDANWTMAYELAGIYSMAEFEEKFRTRLEQQQGQ